MTIKNQIYKCEVCGNIVEVLHIGAGELVCCGQPMKLMEEKIEDEGREKHVPVIKESLIQVGEVEHPMEENHFIEWIEITTEDKKRFKKFLKAGDQPQIQFNNTDKIIEIRSYCNVHGLWKLDIK